MLYAKHLIITTDAHVRTCLDVSPLKQGKVEMEVEILTKEESEAKPAGESRDDPNLNPVLEPPK